MALKNSIFSYYVNRDKSMNKIVKIISYAICAIFLVAAIGGCFFVSRQSVDEELQNKCQTLIEEIDEQTLENETLQKDIDALHQKITELKQKMN